MESLNTEKLSNNVMAMDQPSISGQGQYGCILHRGVQCDLVTPESEAYISKIQKKDKIFENELLISEIIKKIPAYQHQYAPILSSCPIDIANLQPNSIINSCQVIINDEKESGTGKQNSELFTLSKIRYVSNITLNDFLREHSNDEKMIMDSYLFLVNSIASLDSLSIVHFDLKGNNILYDPKFKTPVIIDFGLSFRSDIPNVWESFMIYDEEYKPWCVDIYVISRIRDSATNILESKIFTNDELMSFVDKYVKMNLMDIFEVGDIVIIQKVMNDYFSQFANQTGVQIIHGLLKNIHSWDLYMLAMIYYLELLDRPDSKLLSYFKKILFLSPDKRQHRVDYPSIV